MALTHPVSILTGGHQQNQTFILASPASGLKRNKGRPLKTDFLIVDEASMLDLLLSNHLLKTPHPRARQLFVGDVNQPPLVGAGDVLHGGAFNNN